MVTSKRDLVEQAHHAIAVKGLIKRLATNFKQSRPVSQQRALKSSWNGT